MAQLDLYIDIDRKTRVAGFASSSPFPLPTFAQNNILTFRVRALQPTGLISSPYTFIDNTGRTLQLAVGIKVGNASLHYVEQYTWTNNPDHADPYFYADVNFNTLGIGTLLGANPRADAFLEINLVDGGNPKTILSQQITIEAAVIKNATLTVPVGQTPVSLEAVLAMLTNLVCDSVTIRSPSRNHQRRLWEDDDSTPHDDIT